MRFVPQFTDGQEFPHALGKVICVGRNYAEHAKDLKVDNLLVLNEKEGFNSAVNRGPTAFVDFLQKFENGFGISIRQLMTKSEVSKGDQ